MPQTAAPPAPEFEDVSREEQLEFKREYAIREREKEAMRKQNEEVEKKKQMLANKKAAEEKAREDRLKEVQEGYSKAQVAKKTAAMENEYRDRCREAQITKKRNAWLAKENEKIQDLIENHLADEDELHEAKLEAKERKNAKLREQMEARVFRKKTSALKEKQRDAAEGKREEARKERAIKRIDELKAELDEELEAYMDAPTHIPLKQALCGGLRPVPTVTKLLAALKNQVEDLNDLKQTDLEVRAKAQKKPLFVLVQEIKEGHERERLKPPEPEVDEKVRKKKMAVK